MSTTVSIQARQGEQAQADYASILLLLARIAFTANFMLFGARKFSEPAIIWKLSESMGYPGWLVYPAMALQLLGGFCLLVGFQVRVVAAVFAWFCIVAPSMFWYMNLENFTRDYCAAGGFLLLVLFGAGRISVDAMLERAAPPLRPWVPSWLLRPGVVANTMLVARVLIALPFLADVVNKLLHMEAQRKVFAASAWPAAMMLPVMAVELVCGLMLVWGYRTRLAALVLLAGVAILSWGVAHYPGWDLSFFSGQASEKVFTIFKHRSNASFFKDVTTVAALLILIVHGARPRSRDGKAQDGA